MKVTLAIPNYNGLATIKDLLPTVMKEDFDNVYVLDDASTDNSVFYIKQNFPDVVVVEGKKNLGPGANRNRIIDHVSEGYILFLDADTELVSSGVRQKVVNLFEDEKVGLVGGKILAKAGKQMWWNYGDLMNPRSEAITVAVNSTIFKIWPLSVIVKIIKKKTTDYTFNIGLLPKGIKELEVGWVAEGNFAVRAALFSKLGGFDEKMKYHETHDLCKRIKNEGMIVKYDPRIVVRHLELEVRMESRKKDWEEAKEYFFKKHWG